MSVQYVSQHRQIIPERCCWSYTSGRSLECEDVCGAKISDGLTIKIGDHAPLHPWIIKPLFNITLDVLDRMMSLELAL